MSYMHVVVTCMTTNKHNNLVSDNNTVDERYRD